MCALGLFFTINRRIIVIAIIVIVVTQVIMLDLTEISRPNHFPTPNQLFRPLPLINKPHLPFHLHLLPEERSTLFPYSLWSLHIRLRRRRQYLIDLVPVDDQLLSLLVGDARDVVAGGGVVWGVRRVGL